MIFTELRFLVFFVLVFAVHWSLRGLRARKVWLLLASYAFYCGWDWRFLGLILASTLIDWFAGRGIHRSQGARRRAWLLLSLVGNLGLLATFKYLGFFVDSAYDFLAWMGLETSRPVLSIVLPVGISFYTFQTLSYSIDIWFGRLEPTHDLLDLAVFVAFFPQLVAGPIVRASDFLPQLRQPRRFAGIDVRAALVLFFIGYFKKGVVSDNVAPIVERFFSDPASFDAAGGWGAMLLFSVQLYCDFSGYSDMAIASAALLGYELCLNFDFPYLAPNLRQFWRRWHISLSSWFNDYVYIPLGGSRGTRLFAYRNTMISMLLAGLWHGAAWNFVLWGAYHGLVLVIYTEWIRRRPPRAAPSPLWTLAGTVFTFWIVNVSMILFRASDMSNVAAVCGTLFLGRGSGAVRFGPNPWIVFGLLALLHACVRQHLLQPLWRRVPDWAFAAGAGAVASLLFAFMNGNVQPFIYFQF